jgi:UDP-2-acetamido-2,6-beta-L-arabino-hexul-4-ose reductase
MLTKVGITGQAGFVGTHLYNTLGLYPGEFALIPFEDKFFEDVVQLKDFVKECDVIVHLAAINRHGDPQIIFDTNVRLTEQLIRAMEATRSHPHVLFSSSIQEERDNPYGKSKKIAREMLAEWADKYHAVYTGLIIPNIFGPFGNPYYNSVVATFSHQLINSQEPQIEINGHIKLIFIAELVAEIIRCIRFTVQDSALKISHTKEIFVSEILEMLKDFNETYILKGCIPVLNDSFTRNLFNTFRSYIDPAQFFPFQLTPHTDARGTFVEVMKLGTGGQISFSTTKPGITRGNHFHTRKIERFAVLKGNATIRLRRIGTEIIQHFSLSGEKPSFVDMPVWYTHNITNSGTEDLYTLFWINEFYNPDDPDTFPGYVE